MAADLTALFYIGIIIPTFITITVFIAFLICWFKCNLKQKILKRRKHKDKNGKSKPKDEKEESRQSSDSAIDLRDVETNATEESNRNASISVITTTAATNSVNIPSMNNNNNTENTKQQVHIHHQRQAAMTLDLDIPSLNLVSGEYPSHEKLNEEINSEPPIYEPQEEVQRAILDEHKRRSELIRQRNLSQQAEEKLRHDLILATHKQLAKSVQLRASYNLKNKRHSHSGPVTNLAAELDNKSTDYGFMQWSRPASLSGSTRNLQRLGNPNHLATWRGAGQSLEILHV